MNFLKLSKTICLTSAALLLFILPGCGGPSRQIVGKWKTTGAGGDVTWEFFSNGTLKEDTTSGRYTFGDNQRIKVQTSAATFVYQYEIHGDAMTWTALDGAKTNFARLK